MLALLLPFHLEAQEPDWTVEGEVGGSLFFGNRSQTVFATRGLVERMDPVFETTSEAGFTYGRSTDETGETTVNRRSWNASTDLNFRPEARWSPFVSGRIESSLERQIALRYDTGAGMRLVLLREENARVALSASVVAERTFPRDGVGEAEDRTRIRWSSQLRIEREMLDGRLEFDSETTYRPVFVEFGDFTLRSRNSLSLDLTNAVQLRLTFLDEYDAGAIDRGAVTNNDGQLQVSLVAEL